MYTRPVVHHLRTAVEAALASLESAPPLECGIPPCLGCLQSMIWPVEAEHTNGRARFTVAILVGLLRVLPERYQSRTYFYVRSCPFSSPSRRLISLKELVEVITSDAGLDSLADYARISEESADSHTCHGNEAELQEDVDELLAVIFANLRQVCEILGMRDAVLKEICARNVDPPLRYLPYIRFVSGSQILTRSPGLRHRQGPGQIHSNIRDPSFWRTSGVRRLEWYGCSKLFRVVCLRASVARGIAQVQVSNQSGSLA